MSALGDAFASELHEKHLKPQGFRRSRRTFTRSRSGYTEYYHLQGSAWNSAAGPWRFYLNCGISFDDMPRRSPDRDFPNTHAWMRAPLFSDSARAEYDISREGMAADAVAVAEAIRQCSDYFQRRHAVLRECYRNHRYRFAFLADPELEARYAKKTV